MFLVPAGRAAFGGHPLQAIRALDYTILFARDLPAIRRCQAEVMRFEVCHEIADKLERVARRQRRPFARGERPLDT